MAICALVLIPSFFFWHNAFIRLAFNGVHFLVLELHNEDNALLLVREDPLISARYLLLNFRN